MVKFNVPISIRNSVFVSVLHNTHDDEYHCAINIPAGSLLVLQKITVGGSAAFGRRRVGGE